MGNHRASKSVLTRRQFLTYSGLATAGIALASLAACAPSPTPPAGGATAPAAAPTAAAKAPAAAPTAAPTAPAATAPTAAPTKPAAAAAPVATTATAATTAPAAKAKLEVVRIAAPLEISGPSALFGQAYLNAAKMVVEEINSAGGVQALGGAKLELVVEDTRSDLPRALELVDKLGEQKDLVGAIGPITSATVVPASLKWEQLQVPYFTPSVDDVITERGLKYFFRVGARMSKYADGVMKFVKDVETQTGVKHKKIGIVSIDVEPGTSAVKQYEAAAKAEGWDFVTETYPFTTTKDFTPMITRLRSAGVDLVVGFQYPPDSILFAQAAQQLDFNPIAFVWAIGGQYLNSFIKSVGKASQLLFDNSYMAPDGNEETKRLNQSHQEKFKEPLTGLGGVSPAVIGLIKDALERAGTADRKAVRDALAGTDIAYGAKYWTIPGGCKFDAKGDNVKAEGAMIQIVDGLQYLVWPAAQAAKKSVWPRPKWSAIG